MSVLMLCLLTVPYLRSLGIKAAQPKGVAPRVSTKAPTFALPTGTNTVLDPADTRLNSQIDSLLATMTIAERVGQLFVIAFDGHNTRADSDIAQLINIYGVGGVILSPQNQNFSNTDGEDTPRQVAKLTNQLQALAYGYVLPSATALTPIRAQAWPPTGTISVVAKTGVKSSNLPLLIGVKPGGADLPTTTLRRGFTPLPTQLALGATWNLELTRQVGQIVGREFRTVGLNLLLGPNLDVMEQPRTGGVGALGIQAFGGDPYWVSQLGRAYIKGVHEGSGGCIATIAGHFPGQGSIDRSPNQEVATVQKDLSELRRVELVPFFSVTQQPPTLLQSSGGPDATDGLLSSSTRYYALQGGRAGRAEPLSLAPELNMLLNSADFKDWQVDGGILMSNALGIPALRHYYEHDDAALQGFSYRRVALDAFTAGHDLLYLDDLQSGLDWSTRKQAMIETIRFFQERYTNDPDFAARVDVSLRRVLRLKLRLYANPNRPINSASTFITPWVADKGLIPLQKVLVQESDLNVLNPKNRQEANKIIEQVARESLTILYPDGRQLSDALPAAPGTTDRLLIFSDSRRLRECDQCTTRILLRQDEVAHIIDNLYGKKAIGQVRMNQIVSLTFTDLAQWLNNTNQPTQVPTAAPTVITSAVTSDFVITKPGIAGATAQLAKNQEKDEKIKHLINEANWLIFVMLDVNPDQQANSDVVKQFLRQRGEQLGNKRVIVFALNAPYFLDATEISKLTAYFGVYSETQPFLENAVHALFRSYLPTGAPPVDVPGTRFDSLAARLKPNPERPIKLQLLIGDQELTVPNVHDRQRILQVGATIRIRVGVILDYNSQPVPDNTPVNFQIQYQSDPTAILLEAVPTHNGTAIRDLTLMRPGELLIAARSGEASTGNPLLLNVQVNLDKVTAAQTPTTVSVPPSTYLVTITQGLSPLSTRGTLLDNQRQLVRTPVRLPRVNLTTLLLTLLTIASTLSLLLLVQIRVLPRHLLVHSLLWATIFGLMAYILYGMGLIPGVDMLRATLHNLGPVVVVFIAMLLPLLWLQLRSEWPR